MLCAAPGFFSSSQIPYVFYGRIDDCLMDQ